MSRCPRVLLVLMMCVSSAAQADAVLLNFDNPNRVKNHFFVELAPVPGGWQHDVNRAESMYDRHALERDRVAIHKLALELAAAYGGQVQHETYIGMKGFTVVMTDEAARAMAKDDRVIMIEADLPTHIASVVTTETVGFELTRAREFLAHAGLERLAGRPGALGRRTSPRYLC
jgi:hypothetical protein